MIPNKTPSSERRIAKDTLIEKLVPELVRRGYRVATIKHDVHVSSGPGGKRTAGVISRRELYGNHSSPENCPSSGTWTMTPIWRIAGQIHPDVDLIL